MTLQIPNLAQFDARRIAILGIGVSGRACYAALAEHTQAVLSVWDADVNKLQEFHGANEPALKAASENRDAVAALLDWHPEVVVISPGFPQTGEYWTALESAGVEIWSEIELAWRMRPVDEAGNAAPWLCVTGTNGKTTTVSMLASILRLAGLTHDAIGNIGNSAIAEITRLDADAAKVFVLELSSFQLAATKTMSAHAAVILNIDDDHLEWHRSRDDYAQAKAQIYENVRTACVYRVGDKRVQALVDEADVVEGARAIGYSLGVPQLGEVGLVHDAQHDEYVVVDRAFDVARHNSRNELTELFTTQDLLHLVPTGSQLPRHLVEDALAAATLARSVGVEPQIVRAGLRAFTGGRHRIELVAQFGGISWIDDSKATNAHAAAASLDMQADGKVIWIVGGEAKGADFTDLVRSRLAKLKSIVVIGVDQEPWRRAFDILESELAQAGVGVSFVAPAAAQPMRDAVAQALAMSAEGDVVLLAPACASHDQFASYEQRGDAFAQAIEEVVAGAGVSRAVGEVVP